MRTVLSDPKIEKKMNENTKNLPDLDFTSF